MNRWMAVLVILVTFVVCLPAEAKVYRHYGQQFEFVVPDEWESQERPGQGLLVAFVEPDLRYEVNIVTVLHQRLPAGYTLTDYVNNTVHNQEKMLWQYQLIEKGLVDNPFGPCYQLTFSWRLSWEQQYVVKQLIVSRYPSVYVVTATVPGGLEESYKLAFSRLFDSFSFVN